MIDRQELLEQAATEHHGPCGQHHLYVSENLEAVEQVLALPCIAARLDRADEADEVGGAHNLKGLFASHLNLLREDTRKIRQLEAEVERLTAELAQEHPPVIEQEDCPDCEGSGALGDPVDISDYAPCPTCQ